MTREALAYLLGVPLGLASVCLAGGAALILALQTFVWLATADWIELDTRAAVMLWQADDSAVCAAASGWGERYACEFAEMQRVYAATPPLAETWESWIGIATLVDAFLALPAVLGLALAGTALGLAGSWVLGIGDD